jgi:hypothetical protein
MELFSTEELSAIADISNQTVNSEKGLELIKNSLSIITKTLKNEEEKLYFLESQFSTPKFEIYCFR